MSTCRQYESKSIQYKFEQLRRSYENKESFTLASQRLPTSSNNINRTFAHKFISSRCQNEREYAIYLFQGNERYHHPSETRNAEAVTPFSQQR